MKKLLLILSILLVILTACNGTENTSSQETEPPQHETDVPPSDGDDVDDMGETEAVEPPVEPAPMATEEPSSIPEPGPLTLTSPEFIEGEPIPAKFSCDSENVSPFLEWTEPPTGAQSFALIMDDPDAPGGVWVHWVLYNIPAEARSLPENVPGDSTLEDGSMHGKNSWGITEYGGPCPPGGTHRC